MDFTIKIILNMNDQSNENKLLEGGFISQQKVTNVCTKAPFEKRIFVVKSGCRHCPRI
jgi:hypothetical protein